MGPPRKPQHGAGSEVPPLPQAGVQLDLAGLVEEGSIAGIEDGIILEDLDCRDHRIGGGPTGDQDRHTRLVGGAAAVLVGRPELVGNVPGPTVDCQSHVHPQSLM